MGSMVIFHYNNNLPEKELFSVMMPNRISDDARSRYFVNLMLNGYYSPAYVINSDDLNVAFDTGNGYAPAGVEYIDVPRDNCHTSTRVGDIIVINGYKRMLVMPTGFEEI